MQRSKESILPGRGAPRSCLLYFCACLYAFGPGSWFTGCWPSLQHANPLASWVVSCLSYKPHLEVLHKLAKAEYVTEDADSRQQVIQVFDYVINYFSAFFEENESNPWVGGHTCTDFQLNFREYKFISITLIHNKLSIYSWFM